MKTLFRVHRKSEENITSWIAWEPRLRTLRITWPWKGSASGWDIRVRWLPRFLWINGWKEYGA